jgi:hypothetical protein
MRQRAVEVVGDERTAGASRRVVVDAQADAEHEVVDEQLRAALEQLGERPRTAVGLEGVLLVEPDPGKLAPGARDLVTAAEMLLLGRQKGPARGQPLLAGRGPVLRHPVLLRSGTHIVSAIANCWERQRARPEPPKMRRR